MSFLHPWLLGVGTVAIGLPVLVHYLTRPRPVRLPISTLRFIQEAIRQRRAVHRLRDAIILGLRTLAVLLIAWAFARPLIGERPLVAPGQGGEASRVVIVDVSQSLAAGVHGIQAFERARPAAAQYLSGASGLRANLILAGARPRAVFDGLSSNLAALREALSEAHPRPERVDAKAALAAAGEMLSKAAGGEGTRRELIIVSDFQRSNWGDVDFSGLPEKTLIQLESVAPPQTPPNLALLRVSSQGHAQQGGQITLEAEVGNYSPTPRQVQVEFSLGGAVYRTKEGVSCPANSKLTVSTEAVLQAGGWLVGEARLLDVEDALKADNARPFVLNVRPGSNYLLVTREPASALASSSYFVERALVPARPRDGRGTEKVQRISPGQLDRETLAPADLVVLDHPGKLPAETIGLLASLIGRGKAVLYVAAEPVDASNLKLLVEAAGPALKMPVEFVPATGGPRRNLRLADVRSDLPPFNLFGDSVATATSPLRFTGGLASRRLDGGLAEDVVAGYSDRSAALVVTACGAGSLAVLNADLPASNLPGSPVFVPLIGELTGRLLGEREAADAVLCGEAIAVDLPPEAGPATGLKVIVPASGDAAGQLADEAGGSAWRLAMAGGPGIYRVNRGEATCFAIATAIPAAESDLRVIDPAKFEGQAIGGRRVHYQAQGSEEEGRDNLWVWMAVGCVACMLLELVALKLLKT